MQSYRHGKKKKKKLIIGLVSALLLLGIFLVCFIHKLKQDSLEMNSESHFIQESEQETEEFLKDTISKEQIDYLKSFLDDSALEEFEQKIKEQKKIERKLTVENVSNLLLECSLEQEKAITKECYEVIDTKQKGELLVRDYNKEEIHTKVLYDVNEKAFDFVNRPVEGNRISCLTDGENLILLLQNDNTTVELKKAFLLDNQSDQLTIDYDGIEISYAKEDGLYDGYQNVADVTLEEGKITHIEPYLKKKNGKLLSVRLDENQYRFELDDCELNTLDQNVLVYRLFGAYERCNISDLIIGYDFTDFVLDENDQVVAALISRHDDMKAIRVVIKTNEFQEIFHETVRLHCDSDMEVLSGSDTKVLQAGEELVLDVDSELFKKNRIVFRPLTQTGRIVLDSIQRSQGAPSYRGIVEVERNSQGLLVVNELPLDEYLYSVVPSEMPASYPKEALKAQAVSARTYAYMHMLHAGMAKYGAHVDDSAAFQVYNNCQETRSTTEAVGETENEILTCDDIPVMTYFYSTSCGYGTDLNAWMYREDQYSDAEMRYLKSSIFSDSRSCVSEDAIGDGVDMEYRWFDSFIRSFPTDYYESDETYFRWKYQSEFDQDLFYKTLLARYEANESAVLTLKGDMFCSENISPSGDILSIEVTKRAPGGAACELTIETEEKTYLVLTEKNIRYLLAGMQSQISLGIQYEKEGQIHGMLPSAFLVMEPVFEEGKLCSYTLYGGGFGHGIGMSQNGAKNMAKKGLDYQAILDASYYDTVLDKLEVKGIEE